MSVVARVLLMAAAISVLTQSGWSTMIYSLTVNVTWDGTDPANPGGPHPPSPHFSHLGVVTHNNSVSFWNVGAPATPGIAKMAITGCVDNVSGCGGPLYPTSLEDEVTPLLGTSAQGFFKFKQHFAAPSVTDLTFAVEDSHSLVTAVTMIGPSPDWFVGVSGLNLRPGGTWVDQLTVELFVFNAGIKSTNDLIFNPAGPDNVPIQMIHPLDPNTEQIFGAASAGEFVFTLQTPEPSTWVLCGLGLVALVGIRRYRRTGNRDHTIT